MGTSAATPVVPAADWPAQDAGTVGRLLAALQAQNRLTLELASSLAALGLPLQRAPEEGQRPHGELPPEAGEGAGPGPERPARVAIYCFGTFTLVISGQRVDTGRMGKTRGLLQYLATHHDRPVPRERLIAELWPDPGAAAAASSLKVAVHALRQALLQLAPPGAPGGGRPAGEAPLLTVLAHEAGYRLCAAELWLDVEEFERCCALGRRLERQGQLPAALGFYARAADLYQGDFLADSWDDWVVFRREGLKDRYLCIVARLADAALAAGDYQGCIVRCQQLLSHDRCREDTYRTLMLCHARLGQRDRVRCWYELCVRTLRTELDVDPEPETRNLYRRVIQPERPGARAGD